MHIPSRRPARAVRRIVAVLILSTASSGVAVAQPAPPQAVGQTFTLEQALQFAIDHYPSVRAAVEHVNASTANVNVARAAYLPRLDTLWQTNRATVNNIGVYGHWMLEELHRHGYRLSPGTLYPLLARMAKRGWLRAIEPEHSRDARVYRITAEGSKVLKRLRASLRELQGEVGQPGSRGRREKNGRGERI